MQRKKLVLKQLKSVQFSSLKPIRKSKIVADLAEKMFYLYILPKPIQINVVVFLFFCFIDSLPSLSMQLHAWSATRQILLLSSGDTATSPTQSQVWLGDGSRSDYLTVP